MFPTIFIGSAILMLLINELVDDYSKREFKRSQTITYGPIEDCRKVKEVEIKTYKKALRHSSVKD